MSGYRPPQAPQQALRSALPLFQTSTEQGTVWGAEPRRGQGQGDRRSRIWHKVLKIHAPPSSGPHLRSRVFRLYSVFSGPFVTVQGT